MSFGYSTSFTTKNHNAVPLYASRARSHSRGLRKTSATRFTDHDVVAALVMLDLGIRQERIAKAMGCTTTALRQWDIGVCRRHIRLSMMARA